MGPLTDYPDIKYANTPLLRKLYSAENGYLPDSHTESTQNTKEFSIPLSEHIPYFSLTIGVSKTNQSETVSDINGPALFRRFWDELQNDSRVNWPAAIPPAGTRLEELFDERERLEQGTFLELTCSLSPVTTDVDSCVGLYELEILSRKDFELIVRKTTDLDIDFAPGDADTFDGRVYLEIEHEGFTDNFDATEALIHFCRVKHLPPKGEDVTCRGTEIQYPDVCLQSLAAYLITPSSY